MKTVFVILLLICVSFFITVSVLALCGSYFQPAGPDTFYGTQCVTTFGKVAHWRLLFTSGPDTNDLQVTENGQCFNLEGQGPTACYPGYDYPYWVNADIATWNQVTHNPLALGQAGSWQCSYTGFVTKDHLYNRYCNTNVGNCVSSGSYWNFSEASCSSSPVACPDNCEESGGGWEPLDICTFDNGCNIGLGQPERGSPCCWNGTPILIDVNGDGFNLSDASNGVRFDIIGDNRPVRIGWPSIGSDDAWLALDRNGNGTIDNGRELFGNFTIQPSGAPGKRNGFLALAEYDKPATGGNGNGAIEPSDAAFSNLLLWQDENRNGVSEPNELHPLLSLGIAKLELKHKESKRDDEFGNQFRYRARVVDTQGSQAGRWAWDVIPTFQH